MGQTTEGFFLSLKNLADSPVSRLNKITTIPVEGAPAFKDPADKRAEAVTRYLYTVVGSAVRPTVVGVLVSDSLNGQNCCTMG